MKWKLARLAIQAPLYIAAAWLVYEAITFGRVYGGLMGAVGGGLLAIGGIGLLYFGVRVLAVKLLERLMAAFTHRLWAHGTNLSEFTDEAGIEIPTDNTE